jgi:hypothetical protein
VVVALCGLGFEGRFGPLGAGGDLEHVWIEWFTWALVCCGWVLFPFRLGFRCVLSHPGCVMSPHHNVTDLDVARALSVITVFVPSTFATCDQCSF